MLLHLVTMMNLSLHLLSLKKKTNQIDNVIIKKGETYSLGKLSINGDTFYNLRGYLHHYTSFSEKVPAMVNRERQFAIF